MSYQLVIIEPKVEGKEKSIGENVFLENLKYEYKVYLFYYPGAMPNIDLEDKLRELGNITGKNLFVNIGDLNDPKFETMSKKFGINKTPVVIITGIDGVASLKDENDLSTAYARLDNKDLLKCIDSTIACVQSLFNLFIAGEILEALKQGKEYNRDTRISFIKDKIGNELREIAKFLWEKDIDVSLFEGKFTIRDIKDSTLH